MLIYVISLLSSEYVLDEPNETEVVGRRDSMFFSGTLNEVVIKHVRDNLFSYVLTIAIFCMGIIFGALAVKTLDPSEAREVLYYLERFFNNFDAGQIPSNDLIIQQSIVKNIQTCFAAGIFGISVIGVPVVLIILFIRGFVIGFTVGFLVEEMFLKGVLMAFLSVLPHNIFVIPAILLVSSSSISFAGAVVKTRAFRTESAGQYSLFKLVVLIIGVLLLIVIGGFIEAYVTPVFINIFSRHLL